MTGFDRQGVPVRLRLPEALQILGELRGRLATRPSELRQLDLAPLQDIDSSALAVLLALRREFGDRLQFSNASARLRSLARLYGLESLLFGSAGNGPG